MTFARNVYIVIKFVREMKNMNADFVEIDVISASVRINDRALDFGNSSPNKNFCSALIEEEPHHWR